MIYPPTYVNKINHYAGLDVGKHTMLEARSGVLCKQYWRTLCYISVIILAIDNTHPAKIYVCE